METIFNKITVKKIQINVTIKTNKFQSYNRKLIIGTTEKVNINKD